MGRDYSVIGRALAAPARSAMLDLLMDGSARPAGELAVAAGSSPPQPASTSPVASGWR